MKQKIKNVFILLFLVSLLIIYLTSNKTYTSYESLVEDEILLDVANWEINVDGQNIAKSTREISLKNIEWTSEHTNNKTVAPGSKGVIRITIDPANTQVAVDCNVSYIDHKQDENIILTVTSMYLDGEEWESTEENSYSGIITLDQIKNKEQKHLVINVEWINNEENNEVDSKIGLSESEPNYLKLELTAKQYTGE